MKKMLCSAVVLSSLVVAGCTIDPYTGEQKVSKTAIGAVAGAAVGAAVSSKKDRTKGALIGAAVGGGTGYYFDRQEAILREKLQGTGVSVTRTENGIILNMPGNISFPSGQYAILPSFYDTLNSVALVLKEFDKTAVKVSGHTDSTGGFELNQKLSENRASSVSDYLASQGVSRARLHSYGYGPRYPVASNDTPQGRAANRRVEIEILNP
ncbi:MAG: OmpA family protein [Gammaproteobacteria bacterium]|jgi:outer membrane protein OmpA-like peptidoglycan-associated protein